MVGIEWNLRLYIIRQLKDGGAGFDYKRLVTASSPFSIAVLYRSQPSSSLSIMQG